MYVVQAIAQTNVIAIADIRPATPNVMILSFVDMLVSFND